MRTIGIDEVGRGSWAGPLVAGAVLLEQPIQGLKDSKKLTKKQRTALAMDINAYARAIGLGWVTPKEIDRIGLSKAVGLAMERALQQINTSYDEIIIDGNVNYFPENSRARAIIKADDSIPAVSAASIIAKVARDRYMTELSACYPGYGFERHVGYGTALHARALQQLGVCDIHRLSYKPIRASINYEVDS